MYVIVKTNKVSSDEYVSFLFYFMRIFKKRSIVRRSLFRNLLANTNHSWPKENENNRGKCERNDLNTRLGPLTIV